MCVATNPLFLYSHEYSLFAQKKVNHEFGGEVDHITHNTSEKLPDCRYTCNRSIGTWDGSFSKCQLSMSHMVQV